MCNIKYEKQELFKLKILRLKSILAGNTNARERARRQGRTLYESTDGRIN
jgi:hypothetical protein